MGMPYDVNTAVEAIDVAAVNAAAETKEVRHRRKERTVVSPTALKGDTNLSFTLQNVYG
jgi:hypothetical protein